MEITKMIEQRLADLHQGDWRDVTEMKFTVTMPASTKLMLDEIVGLIQEPITRFSGEILHKMTEEAFQGLSADTQAQLAQKVEHKYLEHLKKVGKENGFESKITGEATVWPYWARITKEGEAK